MKVINEDMPQFKPTPGVKHKDVYLRVFNVTKKAMYTNQTGRFPITSSRGNKYLMVAIEMDGNYINAKPLKTRETKSPVAGYQASFSRWKTKGVMGPNWHMLDNEAPKELKQAIQKN